MRRPTGAAGALLARHAEPTGRVCPKFGRKLQPGQSENQSATSGSFSGTNHWKCAESDAGNPQKSMILHRMVPSDSAKSVLTDLSVPPVPNSAFWRPFRTQKVRPAAAVPAPSAICPIVHAASDRSIPVHALGLGP